MSYLRELYDRSFQEQECGPVELHPDRVSTNRFDDIARLARGERGRLLDIGCSAGSFTFALGESFDSAVGTDISALRIDRARQALRERYSDQGSKFEFVVATADGTLPFEDASFDMVVACAVLEHVLDLFKAVEEMARVCKPGGCVIITVPNLAYLMHVGALLLGRQPLTGIESREMDAWRELGWDGGHLHYFTKASLSDLLVQTGLTPERWTGDGRWAKWRRWYQNFVGNLTVRARREP